VPYGTATILVPLAAHVQSAKVLMRAKHSRRGEVVRILVVSNMPGLSGGLNGSTQHSPEVLSAGVSMAKFVRER